MVLERKLNILVAAAEVAPFAKTGGLADVAGSLPIALAALGHDARIVMPKYRSIDTPPTLTDFPVRMGQHIETALVRHSTVNGKLPVYFIDNYHYFDREGFYCHLDDGERFAFFSKALLEMLPHIGFRPDIIHLNDWQTGPVTLLLREVYSKKAFYQDVATLFTVHNLKYQGNYDPQLLNMLGLPQRLFKPEGVEFFGQFSFMKAGLCFADIINTVSRTYAKEILTRDYGERMEGVLQQRAHDLFGIVNGISYEDFNPETDLRIAKNFGPMNITDKAANKSSLQQELCLPAKTVPLLSIVSRLVEQKGLDLLAEVLDHLLGQDVQLVVLGEGEERFHRLFTETQRRYPHKLGLFLGFNSDLAHRIYAGSDIFLMPSQFEPCGLGQIIALRYGCIPVVRATGGLADTICDYDEKTGEGSGFVFREYESAGLKMAVDRALKLYSDSPEKWQELVSQGMGLDFSWDKSAKEYLELYQLAIKKRREQVCPDAE